ncbi:MAG: aminotransferase class I/II-fold pyridoxal phosphate-dependent enzyme [Deltaproteobacteria bacterium]|nr:aminotransferase class I/II-fold pyridoxal phosphate-dependent enzyme [Deltaproteobacteria bacterium]
MDGSTRAPNASDVASQDGGRSADDAIAIVGMGCRFAGAPDLQAFWRLTVEGRDAFGPVPADRWDQAAFFDANPRQADRSYAPTGAFIDDVRSFPAVALQVPPRRVEVMDPQQRFALETSLQAVEDSGRRPADLPRRTGVYVGVTAVEYRTLSAMRIGAQLMASGALGQAPDDPEVLARAVERMAPPRPFTAPGVLANMVAATVAQELRVHGPAYTTDAACASALVALSDAVMALRTGAIDAALAGGVYLCLTPEHHIAFSRIGAMSKSGRCLPFDARADGFVQGDGAGMVLLRRLSDARRDGDRIYAVIHGIATNNDGGGEGPMAPVRSGQVEVVRAAWQDARLSPAEAGYVETHGTGTSVGDQIELEALSEALGDGVRSVALGSSKANVGHTMSAAGIAGLIRTALAVHHGTVPPMAGFESAKPELGLDALPYRIPTAAEPWTGARRVAAISSFGFGGTNGHIVLAGPEPAKAPPEQAELVLMSAPDLPRLRDLAARTADAVAADPSISPAGLARAWAVRRSQPARLGVVARSRAELIEGLRAIAEGRAAQGAIVGEAAGPPPKVAFLYPGQGAQRPGMLADACQRFPVFAEALDEVERALEGSLSLPLTHLLYPERRATPVDEAQAAAELTATEHAQPALLAVAVGLTRLLAQAGVRPDAVLGHSVGEFSAATAAGVMGVEDAARLVAARGAAMERMTRDEATDRGAMLALVCDAATAETLLSPGAVIANINHPRQVVVSGATAAIAATAEQARSAGVEVVRLNVSHGFHSPIFDGLDLDAVIDTLDLRAPAIPVASCIQERPYEGPDDARAVFRAHATSPVLFTRGLEQCLALGCDLYLQVGAGGPLRSFARGTLPRGQRGILSLASSQDRDGGASLLEGLAQLYVLGVDVDVSALCARAPVASAPPTVLPREVYWILRDTAQRPTLAGASATAQAPVPAAAPAASELPTADAGAPSRADRVLAAVARASSYPLSALRPEMKLGDDLGFDSMMVADLAEELTRVIPGVQGIPREILINSPSIQDIIDFAESPGATAPAADDDAPLHRYAPVWLDAPLASPAGSRALAGRRFCLVGPGAETCAPVAAALTGAGLERAPDGAAHVEILVYAAAMDPPVPVSALLSGEAAPPDPTADLLARLAEQRGTPDVVVLRRDDDVYAEALTGAARALAREWTEARVVSLRSDRPEALGEAVLAALGSHESTVDVRIVEGLRQIAGTSPLPDAEPEGFAGTGDLILVTGGTRGIGLAFAREALTAGAHCLLVSRGGHTAESEALASEFPGRVEALAADVTDRDALREAVSGRPVTVLVHAAGLLADGPLESVDPALGRMARAVKVEGLVHAIAACGPTLRAALVVGSWAGRFGSRHQVSYAAGNALASALVAALPERIRGAAAEFGPWASSEMVSTIPKAIQAAMRAEGVDFVGDAAGLRALCAVLAHDRGPAIVGRRVPASTQRIDEEETLSPDSHPFLADHAIDGLPVLPLASAATMLADAAGLEAPFAIEDLTLYSGITAAEPTRVLAQVRGDRAELRAGPKQTLSYSARLVLRPQPVPERPPRPGGAAPTLSLEAFYDGITFHGPLLQGIRSIEVVGDDFIRGRVRTSRPADWVARPARPRWAIDPLTLDSALQLAGYVAWVRHGRAGTPVGIRSYTQLAPLPDGEVSAEVWFDEGDEDRFVATVMLRDDAGALLALAEGVTGQMRRVEATDEAPAADDDGLAGFKLQAEWTDPAQWPGYKDLQFRLQGVKMMGLDNPYFDVHEGTAKNTSVIAGREVINFSSYNYLGLSGDPRVRAEVVDAMDRYGTSVSASRVASGERPFHRELEDGLARAQGVEAALAFPSGHATNVNTIGHLFGPNDLVLHDELIHDSCLQGIKLSGSARQGFRHDDPEHARAILKKLRRHYEKVLIVVEGAYSMDGDLADLPALIALRNHYGCMLMVDEAHSFGTVGETGCGVREHFAIDPTEVDIWMGTMSKSLASMGGWIAGRRELIDYMRYTTPGFVFAAGMTPTLGQAALSSLRYMLEEPWRVHALQSNARFFQQALSRRGVDTGLAVGLSPVVPAITGDSMQALHLSQRLLEQGINAKPIIFPAVANDAARLRFFLTALHTEAQLDHTARCVADTLATVREELKRPRVRS